MIIYYDDEKGKEQSHEISADIASVIPESFCVGYGATYEESKIEFLKTLEKQKKIFDKAYSQILKDLSENNIMEIDSDGIHIGCKSKNRLRG